MKDNINSAISQTNFTTLKGREKNSFSQRNSTPKIQYKDLRILLVLEKESSLITYSTVTKLNEIL